MSDMPETPGASFEEAMAAAMASMPEVAAKGPTADDVLNATAAPASATVVPPPAAPAPVDPASTAAPAARPEPIPQAILDREAALEAREKATRAAEERVKALEVREAKLARAAAAFESDPVGYVRAMRPDLTQAQAAAVAERFYMHALGDSAPAQARVEAKVTEVASATDAKIAELQAKLEAQEMSIREAQAEAQRAQYKAQLAAHATTLDAGAHPILAGLAKREPAYFQELLFNEAVRAAQEAQAAGKDIVPLTPAEAAANVESALKAHRDKLYGPATPSPANAPQSAPSQTITNSDASAQANRTPPDSLDDRVLRAAAYKAIGLGHLPVDY